VADKLAKTTNYIGMDIFQKETIEIQLEKALDAKSKTASE